MSKQMERWKIRKRRKEIVKKIGLHLVIISGAIIFILPFLWLVDTSLKPDTQIFKFPPEWVPEPLLHWNWRNPGTSWAKLIYNYKEALTSEFFHFWLFLKNTIYLTFLNIIGVLFSCSLVAYSFARLRWPGRNFFFLLLISTMMVPGQVTMVPVFLIMKKLGWVDTFKPLWVGSFFGNAFYIFLLRQFFMTIPTELEDAAKIDGAGFLGIYWRVILPLSKPALAAVVIFQFMASWNDFMGPLIYLNSMSKFNLSYGLYIFQSQHGGEWGTLMAASTLMILPVIVIFFLAQRYFIQGVTLTGLKG